LRESGTWEERATDYDSGMPDTVIWMLKTFGWRAFYQIDANFA